MSLIINTATIPELNGIISFMGTPLDKIMCNGVQVWKLQKEVHIANTSELSTYLDMSPASSKICETHSDGMHYSASVWYSPNQGRDDYTYVTWTPKPPFTKIRATVWNHGGLIKTREQERHWMTVNGTSISSNSSIDVEANSISLVLAVVGAGGWKNHWKSEQLACIRNVTVL